MKTSFKQLILATGVLALGLGSAWGQGQWFANTNAVYAVSNLVADTSGTAPKTDPRLLNPWGILATPEGVWVALNHSGLVAGYGPNGTFTKFAIHVPTPDGGDGSPTGLIFNDSNQFVISNGSKHGAASSKHGAASFLVATEDGTIAAWNHSFSGSNAVIVVDRSESGAIYKGLAMLRDTNGTPHIYAANFHDNAVEVFDGSFNLVNSFTDSSLPQGFAPFNIASIYGKLFVSFALQGEGAEDDQPGAGNGYIDVFDTDGTLLRQFASQGVLNSPWAMVVAPGSFGKFGGSLLVGNFGDGAINAFDLISGKSLGALSDKAGNIISIDGLWGLAFNRQASKGRWDFTSERLYFTAGPNGEDDGLLGYIKSAGKQVGGSGPGQGGSGQGNQGGQGDQGGRH